MELFFHKYISFSNVVYASAIIFGFTLGVSIGWDKSKSHRDKPSVVLFLVLRYGVISAAICLTACYAMFRWEELWYVWLPSVLGF